MDEKNEGFKHLRKPFRQLREAKMKKGIFTALDIRKLIPDSPVGGKLNQKESAAWKSFISVVKGSLDNSK